MFVFIKHHKASLSIFQCHLMSSSVIQCHLVSEKIVEGGSGERQHLKGRFFSITCNYLLSLVINVINYQAFSVAKRLQSQHCPSVCSFICPFVRPSRQFKIQCYKRFKASKASWLIQVEQSNALLDFSILYQAFFKRSLLHNFTSVMRLLLIFVMSLLNILCSSGGL